MALAVKSLIMNTEPPTQFSNFPLEPINFHIVVRAVFCLNSAIFLSFAVFHNHSNSETGTRSVGLRGKPLMELGARWRGFYEEAREPSEPSKMRRVSGGDGWFARVLHAEEPWCSPEEETGRPSGGHATPADTVAKYKAKGTPSRR